MLEPLSFTQLLQGRWREFTLYASDIMKAFEDGPYGHLYDRVHSLERKVTALQARRETEAGVTSEVDPAAPETTQRRNSASS